MAQYVIDPDLARRTADEFHQLSVGLNQAMKNRADQLAQALARYKGNQKVAFDQTLVAVNEQIGVISRKLGEQEVLLRAAGGSYQDMDDVVSDDMKKVANQTYGITVAL
ncbi:MAG: hypothetical protein ACRCZD_08120 [Phycicoccus sp.]